MAQHPEPPSLNPVPGKSKDGPNWIVIVAALVLTGLVAVGALFASGAYFFSKAKQRAKSAAEQAQLGKAMDSMVDDTIQSMEGGDVGTGTQRIEEISSLLEKAAGSASPGERAQMLAAQRALLWIGEPLPAYQEAVQALESSEFLNPGSLSSLDRLAEVRQIVKRFRASNTELEMRVRGLDAKLMEELANAPISQGERDKFFGEFVRASNQDLNLRIRQTDTRIADAVDTILDVLEHEWGKWKATEEDGYLFQTPEAREKFLNAVNAMTTAAEEQQTAQQELAQRLRARQSVRKPGAPARDE
jgi:hypothetical protein